MPEYRSKKIVRVSKTLDIAKNVLFIFTSHERSFEAPAAFATFEIIFYLLTEGYHLNITVGSREGNVFVTEKKGRITRILHVSTNISQLFKLLWLRTSR